MFDGTKYLLGLSEANKLAKDNGFHVGCAQTCTP